jgi:hypothetical protein
MINEFPDAFKKVFRQMGGAGVVAIRGSECLEFVKALGSKLIYISVD